MSVAMGPLLTRELAPFEISPSDGVFLEPDAKVWRMAREKYESLLRCPMCDRTGLADMSDNKSTKIGDYDTRVEAVTQGFEVKGKDVICSECQVSAL
jgi:hypothetical protein